MSKILVEDINKVRKLMLLNELEFVELEDTSYSNVKYDNDATKNDKVNKGLLDDLQKAGEATGVILTITTAKSGHNENVAGTDRISRHMNGTGVDVAILDGIGSGGATNSTNGNSKFRELGFKVKDALVDLGYIWNTESGNDKAVLWQTNTGGNHYNHLHVSNKAGASEEELSGEYGGSDDENELLNNILNQEYNGKKIKDLIDGGDLLKALEDFLSFFSK